MKTQDLKTQDTRPEAAAEILRDVKTALCALRARVISQEEAFLRISLPERVKMGLHCLKAHVVFCYNPGRGGNPTGKDKHRKQEPCNVNGSLSLGFEGWLKAECPWLEKTKAYRYMTALKGLGLDENATDEEVEEAVAQTLRVGPASVKSLCDAAAEAVTPAALPPRLEQSEFEFLRDSLAAYREQSEAVLALKSQLEASPDMFKAACARAYATLAELTGTQWQPSDEPDALAHINPDHISL